MKEQYETEKGFKIRLEARLKNAELIKARESLGLMPKEAAERIGLSYSYYLSFESMKNYPCLETQTKICDFYRKSGVFMLEEDIFPEELRKVKPERKYIAETTIPKAKLISLSTIDTKLLPPVEIEVEKGIEYSELKKQVNKLLATLTPREEKVIKMRFGIGVKSDYTFEEIGQDFEVTRNRIMQIEAKALRKLRHPSISKTLKSFIEE